MAVSRVGVYGRKGGAERRGFPGESAQTRLDCTLGCHGMEIGPGNGMRTTSCRFFHWGTLWHSASRVSHEELWSPWESFLVRRSRILSHAKCYQSPSPQPQSLQSLVYKRGKTGVEVWVLNWVGQHLIKTRTRRSKMTVWNRK